MRTALQSAIIVGLAISSPRAATLPPGFTEALIASGLSSPTAMQFAPDGRLFVCEQGGRLRVIKDGALLPTPFVTLTVNSIGRTRAARRGLRSGISPRTSSCTSTTRRRRRPSTTGSAASPPTATSPSPAAKW